MHGFYFLWPFSGTFAPLLRGLLFAFWEIPLALWAPDVGCDSVKLVGAVFFPFPFPLGMDDFPDFFWATSVLYKWKGEDELVMEQ